MVENTAVMQNPKGLWCPIMIVYYSISDTLVFVIMEAGSSGPKPVQDLQSSISSQAAQLDVVSPLKPNNIFLDLGTDYHGVPGNGSG